MLFQEFGVLDIGHHRTPYIEPLEPSKAVGDSVTVGDDIIHDSRIAVGHVISHARAQVEYLVFALDAIECLKHVIQLVDSQPLGLSLQRCPRLVPVDAVKRFLDEPFGVRYRPVGTDNIPMFSVGYSRIH